MIRGQGFHALLMKYRSNVLNSFHTHWKTLYVSNERVFKTGIQETLVEYCQKILLIIGSEYGNTTFVRYLTNLTSIV
jgi:hypothetical protein